LVGNLWLMMIGDLAIVFLGSVTLHYRLYGLRPGPSRLTDFYLCMSVGGVIGGIFCALVAPALFDWLYEYPLLILGAALLMPLRPDVAPLSPMLRRWVPLVAILLSMFAGGLFIGTPPVLLVAASLIAIAFLARAAIGSRIVFATCIAALILGLGCWANIFRTIEHHSRTRSYFGIYTVGENGSGIGRARILIHGTTTHGIQLRDPALATWPTSYHAQGSGIGVAMRAAPAMFGAKARIGVVGLGAGTLACYARPGQDWRFYEIDRGDRARPARLHFPVTLPARRAGRDRRCTADARLGACQFARPAGDRCLLVRRGPDAPADARGDRQLWARHHARRAADVPHLEQLCRSRARPRGGRGGGRMADRGARLSSRRAGGGAARGTLDLGGDEPLEMDARPSAHERSRGAVAADPRPRRLQRLD
jgi:hypothetical protein